MDPSSTRAADVTIEDVPAAHRYEAHLGDQLAGWVDYRRVRDRLVAIHTEVPEEFGGRGVASALVRRVIADARAQGTRITPRCPFFVRHFARHPEDRDVVAYPRGEEPKASEPAS